MLLTMCMMRRQNKIFLNVTLRKYFWHLKKDLKLNRTTNEELNFFDTLWYTYYFELFCPCLLVRNFKNIFLNVIEMSPEILEEKPEFFSDDFCDLY